MANASCRRPHNGGSLARWAVEGPECVFSVFGALGSAKALVFSLGWALGRSRTSVFSMVWALGRARTLVSRWFGALEFWPLGGGKVLRGALGRFGAPNGPSVAIFVVFLSRPSPTVFICLRGSTSAVFARFLVRARRIVFLRFRALGWARISFSSCFLAIERARRRVFSLFGAFGLARMCVFSLFLLAECTKC